MSVSTTHEQQTQSVSTDSTLLQQLSVLAFGAFILFMVGFSPLEVAHNAAHDTRHSFAFPCH